jgi:3-demethoxyubiquinol 3-hydroxylase
MDQRHYTLIDHGLISFDAIVKSLFGNQSGTARPYPAQEIAEPLLPRDKRQQIAGLMRVNHAGEVAAQGLYQGQVLMANTDAIKTQMAQAAAEEYDHLQWCQQRLEELGSRPSYLQPLWYVGSLAIGVFAGRCGDGISLGFLEETERQVTEHLTGHLQSIIEDDAKSAAIIQQMRVDEIQHGETAKKAGGVELPALVKIGMKFMAKVMTKTAYWL